MTTAKAHSLTLRQLEIFAAVAHQGSFTRGAEALFLSEAAVSQQVKLLETIVGVQLFDRKPRQPVSLTDAGSLLLQTCESVFRRLEDTLQQLNDLSGAGARRVSLGVGTCFGSYVLPPILAGFQQANPGILLTVRSELVGHWPERVRRREMDLAVATNYVECEGLSSVQFGQKELVWVAASGHQLAGRTAVSFDELKNEPLIVGPAGSSTRRALDLLIDAQGVVLHPVFELASNEACITAVVSGMGVALVPYPTALSRELSRSIAFLNVEGFPLRLDWSLVWRTNDLSPAAAAFRDYLLGPGHEVVASWLAAAQTAQGERERVVRSA